MRRLLIAGMLALSAVGAYAGTKDAGRREHSESVWVEAHDGERLEVRIRGNVDLDEDSTSIAQMAPGSSILVEAREHGTTRTLTAEPGAGGGPSYTYKVDGRVAPFDGEARAWLATMLERAVRSGAINLEARVARILQTRGPAGVIDEAERAESDYMRSALVDALAGRSDVDVPSARRALAVVAKKIESDYYKEHALSALADYSFDDAATRDAYFAAFETLGSDYYQSEALGRVVDRHTADADLLGRAVAASARIASDYYRAATLTRIAERTRDEGVRAAVARAAREIRSDYYRDQVLDSLGLSDRGRSR
jgi:hypothetical protein